MKKKIFAVVLVAAVAVVGLFSLGMGDRQGPSERDAQAIRNTVTGAFETEMQLGSFQSPDGTTASLPQEEVDRLVQEYADKVNRYYTEDYFGEGSYAWLNEYYLRDCFRTKVGSCQGGGASDLVIDELVMQADGSAKVSGSIACWNQWIVKEADTDYYTVQYPIDRVTFEFIAVNEQGQWKLQDNSVFDPEPIESLDPKELASMEVSARITDERDAVVQKPFATYEEALAALQSLR